ncbi:oxidoreductase, short chain dehydrogenase/reductase family protein [Toxoplasma gondii]|uniref:Oxidoreductase, short chain dehydrogenase/reductase family protein n=1 Tax=Toxoplasma gondii TaxID=5811 RepID=A0A7J6KG03_TOXGO|nr:oxidoreductase, short chain dehydrogenase/reductase family protein [Toxoplasma gondii]
MVLSLFALSLSWSFLLRATSPLLPSLALRSPESRQRSQERASRFPERKKDRCCLVLLLLLITAGKSAEAGLWALSLFSLFLSPRSLSLDHSQSWGDVLDACWSSSSFVSRALCLGIASFRGAAFALSAFHSWREREKAQERKLAVLVTGSSSGIGLQVTRLLLALDFYVIGTRLHSEDPRRVFDEICGGSTRTPEGGAEPRPAAAGERPRREETEEREDERERERKEDSRLESGESGETIGQTKQDGAEHRRRWRGSRTQSRRPAEAREGADRERGDAGVTENREQENVQTECGVGDETSSRLLLLPMDVTNAEDVARAVEATKKFLRENDVSGLYALVNCAGIWNWNFIQTQSPQETEKSLKTWRELFDVNLLGAVRVMHAFLPLMQAFNASASTGGGASVSKWRLASLCAEAVHAVRHQRVLPALSSRAVFVGSILGRMSSPGQTAYCASKAAVRLLAEGARSDARDAGVNVVLVEPGATRTHLFDKGLSRMHGPTSKSGQTPLSSSSSLSLSSSSGSLPGFPFRCRRHSSSVDTEAARSSAPTATRGGVDERGDRCLLGIREDVFIAQCSLLRALASPPERIAREIVDSTLCAVTPPTVLSVGWDTYAWRLLEICPFRCRDLCLKLLFLSPGVHRFLAAVLWAASWRRETDA